MEKKKMSSGKRFWKKFKRNFKKFCIGIKNFFVRCYQNFMKLSKTVRIIIGVWVAVLLVILILVIASNANNKKLKEYAEIEQKLNDAAILYVENSGLNKPTVSTKLKLDAQGLIDMGYVDKSLFEGKLCKGYSIIYYDENGENPVVGSYLNCKNYTTKDYFVNID